MTLRARRSDRIVQRTTTVRDDDDPDDDDDDDDDDDLEFKFRARTVQGGRSASSTRRNYFKKYIITVL